jgi:hypothetical protein
MIGTHDNDDRQRHSPEGIAKHHPDQKKPVKPVDGIPFA